MFFRVYANVLVKLLFRFVACHGHNVFDRNARFVGVGSKRPARRVRGDLFVFGKGLVIPFAVPETGHHYRFVQPCQTAYFFQVVVELLIGNGLG